MPESHRWTRLDEAAQIDPGQILDLTADLLSSEETALSDDWVLWRTESGALCASAARCPHLWSHFAAEGEIRGESLVCLSHGWQFDCSGAGTDRYAEPATAITMLPVREMDGAIEVQFPA